MPVFIFMLAFLHFFHMRIFYSVCYCLLVIFFASVVVSVVIVSRTPPFPSTIVKINVTNPTDSHIDVPCTFFVGLTQQLVVVTVNNAVDLVGHQEQETHWADFGWRCVYQLQRIHLPHTARHADFNWRKCVQ